MDKIARTHVRRQCLRARTQTIVPVNPCHHAEIKKEPLADVPPWKRRSALCALWRQFSSFVDFERDASVVWTTRRIACPGECFLWSTKEILEGLCYEEQLQYRTLSTRFAPAWLFPFSADLGDKQTNTPSKGKSRRGQRKKQRPAKHQVETVEVVYEVPCGDLCDAPPDYVARETWRRYVAWIYLWDLSERVDTQTHRVRLGSWLVSANCDDCQGHWRLLRLVHQPRGAATRPTTRPSRHGNW